MTVLSTTTDTATLTLTMVAELAAPPERAWQLWADARQLERWWGPPEWPATFVDHDLAPGGRSHYYMTGPEGEQAHGWWRIEQADPPRGFSFVDGFADATGAPDPTMPTTTGVVTLEPSAAGTLLTIASTFATLEQMEQLAAMGMVEGMTLAMGQMDEVLLTTA